MIKRWLQARIFDVYSPKLRLFLSLKKGRSVCGLWSGKSQARAEGGSVSIPFLKGQERNLIKLSCDISAPFFFHLIFSQTCLNVWALVGYRLCRAMLLKFNVHMNHLVILSKWKFWFSRCGEDMIGGLSGPSCIHFGFSPPLNSKCTFVFQSPLLQCSILTTSYCQMPQGPVICSFLSERCLLWKYKLQVIVGWLVTFPSLPRAEDPSPTLSSTQDNSGI